MKLTSVYQTTEAWCRANQIPLSASPTVTSTNDQAKEEAFALSVPLKIYTTDHQTKGRGRGTNEWLNPQAGTSLLITFSFDVQTSPQPITAPLIGLRLYQTLKKYLNLDSLCLKAPNDILMNGKKVAGILIETLKAGPRYRLIVGMGMNILAHPTEIAEAKAMAPHGLEAKQFEIFLAALVSSLKLASQECTSTHFNETERTDLLEALNLNPNLSQKFDSVSPFGDLIAPNGTTSWRDL